MNEETGHKDHERLAANVQSLRFAVCTFSDTRNEETDRSGLVIHELAEAAGHRIVNYAVLRDDAGLIREHISELLNDANVDLIVTNGGTGIAVRDNAYEAVSSLLDKTLDGFGELFRSLSYAEIGAAAMLSRAVGGIACGKVVMSLPGSSNAVRLGMEKLILPQAAHLVMELRKHR